MDWNSIWNTIKAFFTDNGWQILGFFAVLIFGIIVIKIILNITRRIMAKTKMERIAQQFLIDAIKLVLYLILILILLSMVGVEVTGIITALSALILAIGLALENNIANLANGIIIVATHMFKKGDYISVDGVEGSIADINFLFTTVNTIDNKKVTIPNSTIVNNSVSNAGANSTRRVDFTFSVAYESDVEAVKKIILDVMNSNGCVRLEPKPFCRLKILGTNSLDFFANCWVDREDYWDVYYYVVENVYNEFKRNNITVPYSQLEVRNRTDTVNMPIIEGALPVRVEKQRDENYEFNLETASLHDIMELRKHIKYHKHGEHSHGKHAKSDDKSTEKQEVEVAEIKQGEYNDEQADKLPSDSKRKKKTKENK